MNPAWWRRYVLEFGGAMGVYVAAVVVFGVLCRAYPEAPFRYAVALVPVLAVVLVLWAVLRSLAGLDELQRRIQLEGTVFGYVAVGLGTFAYGFLEEVGLPHLSWIWVLPLMIGGWGVGVVLARRRYL
jgi:hypothetical protein